MNPKQDHPENFESEKFTLWKECLIGNLQVSSSDKTDQNLSLPRVKPFRLVNLCNDIELNFYSRSTGKTVL